MKNYNYLFIILLAMGFSNCGDEKKPENSLFTFDNSNLKSQYTLDESLELKISNTNSKEIDSIHYYINERKISTKTGLDQCIYKFKDQKLGNKSLKAIVYFEGESSEATSTIELVSNVTPKLLKYTIVNTYPHDFEAYTQGLEFYRDTLYEGTGNGQGQTGKRGISSLRKTDYKSGKVYKKVELAEKYFGEGITILNNKVYQLTWKNNEGYVYNADSFKKEKTLTYPKQMEGWGLTTDGKYLYMTDSSETIYKLDPLNLKIINYINVYSLDSKVPAVNELEWVNGKIYGNVYQKDAIAVINPNSGSVEGILNLVDLKTKITQLPDTDVLNGIAYNPKKQTFFVTGKNWDKMFEIKIID